MSEPQEDSQNALFPSIGLRRSGSPGLARSGSSLGLQRSGSDVKDAVKTVLKRTSSQITRSSSVGTKEFLNALEATVSGDYEEAAAQVPDCKFSVFPPIVCYH